MTDQRHADLFPREKYATLIDAVEGRLPPKDFVTTSDIACAFGLSVSLISQWREQGHIEGINVASAEKPYYLFFRPSVIRFAKKRAGIEEKPEQEKENDRDQRTLSARGREGRHPRR